MHVHYFEKGSGDPVILLHGFCETGELWKDFADTLAADYRVIVPDLPGYGASAPAPDGFSIDDVATVMGQWVTSLNLSTPVLIGHSLGGYVTLSMARQEPDRFAGIGLFHSTAAPDPEAKKENRNKAIAFVQKHGVAPYTEAFVEGLFHDPSNRWIPAMRKIAASTSVRTLTGYAAAMRDRNSSLEFIHRYSRPILFVAGEHDTLVTTEQLTRQSETVLHPTLVIIKGAGHMGMLENEPESRKAVKKFMELTAGR